MNNSYTLTLLKVKTNNDILGNCVLDNIEAREGSAPYRALFTSALLIFILT